MSRLVAAIPVKNEADTIERCLRSIASICDAVVLSVDTADTQDTETVAREVCRKLGLPLHVQHHVWENHFSNMRNSILDTVESIGADWIISIDGHEYLYPGHAHLLKTQIETLPDNVWLLSLMLKMVDLDGSWRDSFHQCKVWRVDKKIRFERAQHNQISGDLCPPEHRVGFSDIWIMHDRPEENARMRMQQRDKLLPELLQPEVEQDEDALFHMLCHWYSKQNPEEFFALYDRYYNPMASKITPDCQYQIQVYAAAMYGKLASDRNDPALYGKAFACLAAGESLVANRNDHIMQRGRTFFAIGEQLREQADAQAQAGQTEQAESSRAAARNQYTKAFKQFEIASNFPLPATQSFAQVSAYTWEPLAAMGNCMERMGELQQAWMLYNRAIQLGGGVHGNVLAVEREAAASANWPDDKPRLLIIDKLQQFSGDIAKCLSHVYNVRIAREPDAASLGAADIVWCEWVDENALVVSQVRRADKVVFARLHGYEAIEADFPARVTWPSIDALVSVSQQMLDYTTRRFGALNTRTLVIHNGLDLSKFTYRERKPGKNVAWVSLLNNKKNIGLLVLAAREFPEYTFHVAGRWQDARLEEYFWESKSRGGLDNLIYSGWANDLNSFLEDKDFLLNASLWESFSFALHEACAKGIKPLVHAWVSADEFFPRDLQWTTMSELRELLTGPYEPARYRAMAEKYEVGMIAEQYRGLIDMIRSERAEKSNSTQAA